jgi:C1A family cysteine protease
MTKGMGYLRGLPSQEDFHIFTEDTTARLRGLGQPSVSEMLAALGIAPDVTDVGSIPARLDLRGYFSPVEDQGNIGSCTAHGVVTLAEYFQNRTFGAYTNLSRLFVYKMTRNMLGWRGDTGAFVRTAMGALAMCGAPPEKFYPYVERNYDKEPSAFHCLLAQSFQATTYYRLDPIGVKPPDILDRVKALAAAKLPCMFGFTAYESIRQADSMNAGAIPFPTRGEKITGGHVLVVCGYDDDKRIFNTRKGGQETVGAMRVRNSWGVNWGEDGYGWLPYDYILGGLADDFWTLIQQEYVDSGQFGLD